MYWTVGGGETGVDEGETGREWDEVGGTEVYTGSMRVVSRKQTRREMDLLGRVRQTDRVDG